VNILKAEAKKNPAESYDGDPDPARFREAEERALYAALTSATDALEPKLAAEDFTGAGASLAALRGPVDAFFDKVLVNDPDPDVRMNRLRLLSQVRDAANRVADFGLIGG
jgi:glycyl-tRNA synthetase beta chain